MIALLTASLFFEILVHMLNCISAAKARAKTVFGHLNQLPLGILASLNSAAKFSTIVILVLLIILTRLFITPRISECKLQLDT